MNAGTVVMSDTEYPKIETLYNRNPDNMREVMVGDLRLREFGLVKSWLVTEKLNGTNVRIIFENAQMRIGGRTDDASMPLFLIDALSDLFSVETLSAIWPSTLVTMRDDEASSEIQHPRVVLYGEGYGAKIQEGGGDYRADQGFRLFDVAVWGDDGHGGEMWWWLGWENIMDVASRLSIKTVPVLARAATLEEAVALVQIGSVTAMEENATEVMHEGIVARTDPLLLTRRGDRLVWKLKGRDLRAKP